jgi:Arc/MetJ-type ribon-helix-helix transcriptional regulator
MRITVRVPDDLGEEVKRRTDNVSAYVTDALTEKLEREKRKEARRELLRFAGTGIDESLHEINQRERREGDRTFSTD